jgi:hypothetical protein
MMRIHVNHSMQCVISLNYYIACNAAPSQGIALVVCTHVMYTHTMATSDVREAVYVWLADLDSAVDHASLEARFWALARLEEWQQEGDINACLRWGGALDIRGYGIFTVKGVRLYAHRVAVRIGLDGVALPRSVPSDMTVDHVRNRGCIYRDCISPLHLEVITLRLNAGRTRNMNVFT